MDKTRDFETLSDEQLDQVIGAGWSWAGTRHPGQGVEAPVVKQAPTAG